MSPTGTANALAVEKSQAREAQVAHYLVVAHQTATSPELVQRATTLAAEDREALFTLIVPVTPVQHLLVSYGEESVNHARQTLQEATRLFQNAGLTVARSGLGDSSPLLAIEDEIRAHPVEYNAIVLSTFPEGMSRWLRMDVHHQAETKFAMPVIHVIAEPPK